MNSFNPMDPEFLADPYPTYHQLRIEDPVHHSPLDFWVLTRYEDVVAVLRDPRFIKEPLAAFVAARFGVAGEAGRARTVKGIDDKTERRILEAIRGLRAPEARPRPDGLDSPLRCLLPDWIAAAEPPLESATSHSPSVSRPAAEYPLNPQAHQRAVVP